MEHAEAADKSADLPHEPAAPTVRLPEAAESSAPAQPAAGRRRVLAVLAALAAAAALVIPGACWVRPGRSTTAVPHLAPVEVRRLGVSLTILSQPAYWNSRDESESQQAAVFGIVRRAGAWDAAQTIINGPAQSEESSSGATWPGLAMVRDRRIVRNLPQGRSQISLGGVPAGIWPESVRLQSLDDHGRLQIIEQNYRYDLVNSWSVLQRCLGGTVELECRPDRGPGRAQTHPRTQPQTQSRPPPQAPTAPRRLAGKLMSADPEGQIVLAEESGKLISVASGQVRTFHVEALPAGLQVEPTLVWEVDNAGRHDQQFEADYLTWGLTWRADYVLNLRPGKGNGPDTADLVGYATVTNNSGVTWADAELKLLAGDVHLEVPPPPQSSAGLFDDSASRKEPVGFVRRGLFEYHLYALQQRTTLANRETKQIEMINATDVNLPRRYEYDWQENAHTPRVVSELTNSQANHMGVPLPKGVVRLYAPGPDGEMHYAGKAQIDHTPENEKIRLLWGFAFDIACSVRTLDLHEMNLKDGKYYLNLEYGLHNAKPYDVEVLIVEQAPGATGTCRATLADGGNLKWRRPKADQFEIPVLVKAGSTSTVRFYYEFHWIGGRMIPPQKSSGN